MKNGRNAYESTKIEAGMLPKWALILCVALCLTAVLATTVGAAMIFLLPMLLSVSGAFVLWRRPRSPRRDFCLTGSIIFALIISIICWQVIYLLTVVSPRADAAIKSGMNAKYRDVEWALDERMRCQFNSGLFKGLGPDTRACDKAIMKEARKRNQDARLLSARDYREKLEAQHRISVPWPLSVIID